MKKFYSFCWVGGSNPVYGKLPVYDVRECLEENFNPMAWNLVNPQKTIQVLVDGLGNEKVWININRSDLIEEGE